MTVKNRGGFTLVELMTVLLVLGLLITIAIPNLLGSKIAANETAAQATLKTISTALETYASMTNSQFPSSTDDLLNISPPYISENYFDGAVHQGYQYATFTLTTSAYDIRATPLSEAQGGNSFSITTGGVLVTNP